MDKKTYHENDALGSTDIKSIITGGPELRVAMRNQPDATSDAAELGTAFHALVLEPESFVRDYVVAPKFDNRSTVGKSAREGWEHDNRHRNIISGEDYATLANMLSALRAHPKYAQLLAPTLGAAEVPVFSTHGATGMAIKCRPDFMHSTRPVIVDVKTIARIDQLQRTIADHMWHVQAVHYAEICGREIYREIYRASRRPEFWFAVVAKTRELGRHPVRFFRLGELSLMAGSRDRDRALHDWARYTDSGKCDDSIMDLPDWALDIDLEVDL